MTPQQALQMLDNIAKATRLTREEHQTVAQAVNVLTMFIKDKEQSDD